MRIVCFFYFINYIVDLSLFPDAITKTQYLLYGTYINNYIKRIFFSQSNAFYLFIIIVREIIFNNLLSFRVNICVEF